MNGTVQQILVIDDEPGIRESLGAYLEDSGYAVLEAENGRLGLDVVREQQPALVLTDLQMPEMGGLDVLAVMAREFAEIPVIIVSGQGEMSDAIAALQLGAWDYLTKPVQDLAVLEHAVQQCLERAHLLQENRDYQARLEQTVARLQEDEEAGRRIQFQLLPESGVRYGDVSFQHLLLPSATLSGDFVDYFRIDGAHLGFYLADVSGHGLPSALVTVILQNSMNHYLIDCWQQKSDLLLDPSAVLRELNIILLGNELEKYLTMFYGVIDLKDEVLRFANGGQFPFPVLYDGRQAVSVGGKSKPVGLFRHTEYRTEQLPLPDHFLLLLSSDGILELMPQERIEDKEEELLRAVNRLDLSAGDLVSELGIGQDREQRPDDITILVVGR